MTPFLSFVDESFSPNDGLSIEVENKYIKTKPKRAKHERIFLHFAMTAGHALFPVENMLALVILTITLEGKS